MSALGAFLLTIKYRDPGSTISLGIDDFIS